MTPETVTTGESLAAGETGRGRGPVRRLYDWVLHWADTPFGVPALALISFAESSFFPIPPDVLQIALTVARPARAFYYAAVSAVASVSGAVLGWWIGRSVWESVHEWFYAVVPGVTPEKIDYVGKLYEQNAFLAIFTSAFTPIPFKVFTVAAGVFHDYVSLGTLVAASALGRSARFFLVAAILMRFGPEVRAFLEKHFEWMTLLLGAAVVAGFAVVAMWRH